MYNETTPLPEIDFSESTFCNKIDFADTTFGGTADFTKSTFENEVRFNYAVFNEAIFFRTTFKNDTFFYQASFKKTNFEGASFNKFTGFTNTKFNSRAIFDKATFSDQTLFKYAIFSFDEKSTSNLNDKEKQFVSFSDTTFRGDTLFEDIVFDYEANFSESKVLDKGIITFRRTHFNEHATFNDMLVDGRLALHGLQKKHETIFSNGAEMKHMAIEGTLVLDGANLEKVSFLMTDLRKVSLDDCTFVEIKPSKNRLWRALSSLYARKKCLFDETDAKDVAQVETLYRRLKQKFIEEHDWQEVAIWNQAEKDMTIKKAWENNNYLHWIAYQLYRLSSGYGERPLTAFLFLIMVILMAGYSNFATEFYFTPKFLQTSLLDHTRNYFSSIICALPSFLIPDKLVPDEAVINEMRLPNLFSIIAGRTLVTLQIANFIISLRNRFRR